MRLLASGESVGRQVGLNNKEKHVASIPQSVTGGPYLSIGSATSVDHVLTREGWTLISRGKVRDTYENQTDPNHLMVVATDRLSIFDFVLPRVVPRKGEVLTAMTDFWLRRVLTKFPNHLVDMPSGQGLPKRRCLRIKRLAMVQWELIFRAHIGGSVWAEYQKQGTAGGQLLPSGLQKWQKLDRPIFTPSTKEDEGHDINVTALSFFEAMGDAGHVIVAMLMAAYEEAYAYAAERGILILDTKFEVGFDKRGNLYIADEALTPDASRFTTVVDFEAAQEEGRDPVFWDKELVRNWGRTVETSRGVKGIHKLDPSDALDLQFVHDKIIVPDEVIADTMERYLQIFEMLTGMPLEQYQTEVLDVDAV